MQVGVPDLGQKWLRGHGHMADAQRCYCLCCVCPVCEEQPGCACGAAAAPCALRSVWKPLVLAPICAGEVFLQRFTGASRWSENA